MRYKISDTIQFLPVPASLKNAVVGDCVLLKDTLQERQFFVNSTTKIFIEKFYTPKTFADINKEIAIAVKADEKEIKKIIQPFFSYIKHRRFIVPENYKAAKIKSAPLLNANAILDEYKIENLISKNDDVEVYKAIDLNTEKAVVIKVLRSTEQKKINELEREFNFLRTLYKSSVAPTAYTFRTKENNTYFIQEFVDGLSLPQFIKRKKNSSNKLVLNIAWKILYAFKEIHLQNIVHGDIHPSNIILTKENNIKIIDFGLALNTELDKDELVNFGGAYFFMPPERIKKTTYNKFTHQPDFYSDVFQLGVVLYMMLYDEYPFNGITWEDLATEIKEKQTAFPDTTYFNFLIPVWFKNIIAKCVTKNPKERFSNAAELYNAFAKNSNSNAREIRSTIKI